MASIAKSVQFAKNSFWGTISGISIKILMKIKTGSKNSKIGTPRIKKTEKIISENKERTPKIQNAKTESIPTWVRESSEKKGAQNESGESKLQWRKETKKSQRSWSKNKERDYLSRKSESETIDSKARGAFRNTFDKSASYQSKENTSSWDKKSVKPGTGFSKSKTGYKWVGSPWEKSTAPRISTRKWDDSHELSPERKPTIVSKNGEKKPEKSEYKKPKYIAPKPTWEKDIEKVDKKKLIDPTK